VSSNNVLTLGSHREDFVKLEIDRWAIPADQGQAIPMRRVSGKRIAGCANPSFGLRLRLKMATAFPRFKPNWTGGPPKSAGLLEKRSDAPLAGAALEC
jgi:hypothetical protein